MLVKLSKLELEVTLATRKERFKKCRIVNNKIIVKDIVENKKLEVIKLTSILEIAEDHKIKDQDILKHPKVVFLETHCNNNEVSKTYTRKFKEGYFGRRKRF